MGAPFYFHGSASGVLRITGEDRLDFIQRQSTNDLAQLRPDTHLATVLTNPAARILDVLRIFEFDPDVYGAVTLPDRGPETTHFLKRRIFFNDQVRLEDQSAEYAVISMSWESDAAAKLFGVDPIPAGATVQAEIGGADSRILGLDDPLGKGCLAIVPRAQLEDVRAALEAAGGAELAVDEIERRRIEHGIPGRGELIEDFTPLETGLAPFVSDTKGCYTGQEVIARQITYDKVTKGLVGIHLSGSAEAGSQVRTGDGRIGRLTSVVETPELGWIGLAVLKHPHDQPGKEVQIQNGEGEIIATVVDLPFRAV